MGGFQAVASGLGEAGEQGGQGVNQALNEALKVRQQNFIETNAANEIALRYKQLQQQGTLEGQRNDLLRQQIIQFGWKDLGLTLDPKTNTYNRTFYNEGLPEGQNKRTIPMQGEPPDSLENQLARYQTLINQNKDDGSPMFSAAQAKQIVFKMTKDYQGGADQMRGFIDLAKDEYGLEGDAAIKKAEQLYGETVGRGGYFRYAAGLGNPKDLTGLTPGEMREYNASIAPLKAQYQGLMGLMRVEMNNALGPDQQEAVRQRYMQPLMDLQTQEQAILAQLRNKRNPNAVTPITPSKPSASVNQGDMVPVISPQGIMGMIPKANLDKALAQGYKQAPQ